MVAVSRTDGSGDGNVKRVTLENGGDCVTTVSQGGWWSWWQCHNGAEGKHGDGNVTWVTPENDGGIVTTV